MLSIYKSLLTFGIILLLISVRLIVVSPSYAEIMPANVTDIRTSPGLIEVDFVIENTAPMEPTNNIEIALFQGGYKVVTCSSPFVSDINDTNETYGDPIMASCPMGNAVSGVYELQINSLKGFDDKQLFSANVNYTEGTPGVGNAYFAGPPVPGTGGTYSFTINIGQVGFGSFVWADIALEGETAWWQSGAGYSCDKGEIDFPWSGSKTETITCNFSGMPPKSYTMNLYDSRTTSRDHLRDSVAFDLSWVDLKTPTKVGGPASPNKFNIQVERFSTTAPTDFSLKVLDPNSGAISDAVVHRQTYNGIGTTTFSNVDFNTLPPTTYTLVLVDQSNNILDRDSITIESNPFGDTCTCRTMATVYSCTPEPAMEIVRNSCYAGKTTTMTCAMPGVLGGGVTCSCACGGNSTISPGGKIVIDFTTDDLSELFNSIQNVIIAIAVVSGVFIFPYAFILMASGNPEKIKQGTDWLKSIFWGYLVIFLAGFLIRTIGGEVLSLGL